MANVGHAAISLVFSLCELFRPFEYDYSREVEQWEETESRPFLVSTTTRATKDNGPSSICLAISCRTNIKTALCGARFKQWNIREGKSGGDLSQDNGRASGPEYLNLQLYTESLMHELWEGWHLNRFISNEKDSSYLRNGPRFQGPAILGWEEIYVTVEIFGEFERGTPHFNYVNCFCKLERLLRICV